MEETFEQNFLQEQKIPIKNDFRHVLDASS